MKSLNSNSKMNHLLKSENTFTKVICQDIRDEIIKYIQCPNCSQMKVIDPYSAEQFYDKVVEMEEFISSQKEVLDQLFPLRKKENWFENDLDLDQKVIDLFNKINYYHHDGGDRFCDYFTFELNGVVVKGVDRIDDFFIELEKPLKEFQIANTIIKSKKLVTGSDNKFSYLFSRDVGDDVLLELYKSDLSDEVKVTLLIQKSSPSKGYIIKTDSFELNPFSSAFLSYFSSCPSCRNNPMVRDIIIKSSHNIYKNAFKVIHGIKVMKGYHRNFINNKLLFFFRENGYDAELLKDDWKFLETVTYINDPINDYLDDNESRRVEIIIDKHMYSFNYDKWSNVSIKFNMNIIHYYKIIRNENPGIYFIKGRKLRKYKDVVWKLLNDPLIDNLLKIQILLLY